MFFYLSYKFKTYSYKFEYQSCHLFGKGFPTLLAICSFCGCLIIFVCLSLWCWGLDVDLVVSVPECIYLLYYICNLELHQN